MTPKSTVTLASLWPEPDWAQRIAQGVRPQTVAVLAMLYKGFAPSPMRHGTLRLSGEVHDKLYESCVRSMQRLFEQATSEDADQLAAQFHSLTGVPRDSKDVPIETMLRYFALGKAGGRTIRSPFSLSQRDSALAKALPDLGWPADDRAIKTGICHWRFNSSGAYGVAKFTATGIKQLIRPQLTREAAAAEALRLISEELDRNHRQRRSIPKRLMVGQLQRTHAQDVRGGLSITMQELMDRYRMREIRIDPSLGAPDYHGSISEEGLQALNHAYEALHDLSVATGLPPGWIGLSKLCLHLGAPTAHYDPLERTLALPKRQGAGTLAKAWAHALDHHLARYTLQVQITPQTPFLTQYKGQLPSLHRDEPGKHAIAACVLRILNYFETGHVPAIHTSERSAFLLAAQKIESLHGARKHYWAAPEQLFARAFEAFTQDQLSSVGTISPWLAYGTLATDLSPTAAADPYPQGDDRRRLGLLLKELLVAIPAAAKRSE